MSKYSLLSLCNVICMHVLRAGHLVLDNQLVCLPWGRVFLPLLAFLSSSLRPPELSLSTLACLLLLFLFISHLGHHAGDT